MKQVIIDIIKEGWNKNLPVSEVISNIVSLTGLYHQYAQEQFIKYVFVANPKNYGTDRNV